MRTAAATLLVLGAVAAPAQASTATVVGGAVRVSAVPGEQNVIGVQSADWLGEGVVVVRDDGAPLTAGPGCASTEEGTAVCAGLASAGVTVDAGDGDDQVTTGWGDDRLVGGRGDDVLSAGDGDDRLDGGSGADRLDGGPGDDRILARDRKVDTAWCGSGRDRVRAEVLDSLDFGCERVDYGPAGSVGRLVPIGSRGRFVPVPGQGGARVDRRILPDVLYLIRRYRVRVGDGYARHGHERTGEHPLGLAVDLYPGPGGTWNDVDRLARWAEPRQNRPRAPFRWVGYNSDRGHGRGDHLHLSWQHTPGRPGRPVSRVWVWKVRRH